MVAVRGPKCPPERVLLPPQLCSDCGQWSMVSSPFVSPTQSKQFETCELLQPRNFTLVPLSELLCPPPAHPKEKGSVYGNYGTGEASSTSYWSSYWFTYGFSTDTRKTHGQLVFSSASPTSNQAMSGFVTLRNVLIHSGREAAAAQEMSVQGDRKSFLAGWTASDLRLTAGTSQLRTEPKT